MKKIVFLLSVILVIFLSAVCVFAQVVNISGEDIPIYSGAQKIDSGQIQVNGKVSIYSVSTSVEEVSKFYDTFFTNNGYQIIGGLGRNGEYNIMASKKEAKFSLRIYPASGSTKIEFIW